MKKNIDCIKEYKKKARIENLIIISLRFFILIAFIFLWELLANYKIINEFLVSKPTAIFSLLITYFKSGEIMKHINLSLVEMLLGLLIGTSAGLLIAVTLYLFPKVYKIFDPYLVVLNALPKTALAPIIIIWIGTGINGIVAVSVTLSIVVTIISAHTFFVEVDKDKVKMMQTFKANKFQILTKLVIPSNYANLVSLIKINIGLSWVGVIVGEFLVSRGGIGYLVMYGGQVFKLDLVMMGVFILAVIAFIMYEILNLFEKYLRKRNTKKHKEKK